MRGAYFLKLNKSNMKINNLKNKMTCFQLYRTTVILNIKMGKNYMS
jgi:hypothetical protein